MQRGWWDLKNYPNVKEMQSVNSRFWGDSDHRAREQKKGRRERIMSSTHQSSTQRVKISSADDRKRGQLNTLYRIKN
jgi:hypothetical protein